MDNCVRILRRALDLTQEDLAECVGVSRATIIGIEKGSREPSGALVIKIGKFFNKDPRDIFFTHPVNSVQQEGSSQTDSNNQLTQF